MTAKTFDCVEMKRRGAELVQKQLAGMTRQQQLAYWEGRTKLLLQQQAAVRAAQSNATATNR
jgi:hypothetical protein